MHAATASAVQRITKVDTTAPVITVADVSHECSATVDTGVATATDSCDGAPVIFTATLQAGACEAPTSLFGASVRYSNTIACC